MLENKLNHITKIYFVIPYLFLLYHTLLGAQLNGQTVFLVMVLLLGIYHILRSKKWMYQLTVSVVFMLILFFLPIVFISDGDLDILFGVEISTKKSSSKAPEILFLLYLLVFVFLYYFNQKNWVKNGNNKVE